MRSFFCNPCLFRIVIFVVLKRKASYYVIAEKWLKRNYIMNGREREGKKRGEIEKAVCSAGAGSVWSAAVFIVTRLYPLNKKTRMLLNMQ